MFRKCSLVVVSCAFLSAAFFSAASLLAAGKVSGHYLGNGKEAKLAYAVVVPHEDWDDQKAYTLVLSEKDPSKVEKPDFDAMFGELGDALVLNVTQSGDIFGTQVCHQALEKAGFSTSGTVEVDGFKIEGKHLSGHFFTKEEQTFFDDKWSLDLEVEADLP